jgi:hypothetical protein
MQKKEHSMIRNMIVSAAAAALIGGAVHAAEIDVKIINLTGGSYFTPLLVATHAADQALFQSGSAAGASLQAMAEGGDISFLSADLQQSGADVSENPAGGLLTPGGETTTSLMSDALNTSLSVAAMILPTNDGFVALNSWSIPSESGTYTLWLNAYDAGTEANDEIVNGGGAVGTPGIPADPGGIAGSGASGVTAQPEGFVHIHRGILGDLNASGGVSDLDSRIHRWLNPVAAAIVTVH